MFKGDNRKESNGGGFCRFCRFFEPAERKAGTDEIKFGRCRRYAPEPSRDMTRHGYWPLVRPNDWCGDFRDASN